MTKAAAKLAEAAKRREAAEASRIHAHQEREREFWEHVELRMDAEGLSEQQVLDTIKSPGYAGRKARQR